MSVEPRNEGAGAGDRNRLRASDADREQVIDVLTTAFVQGRLTRDELDARVGHVLASRTYADLDALISDLPAGLAGLSPQPVPARIKAPGVPGTANVSPTDGAIIAPAIVAGLALVGSVLLSGPAAALLFLGFVGSALASLALVAVRARGVRRDKQSGEGPAVNRALDAGPGADDRTAPATELRPLPKPRPRGTTDTARAHVRRRVLPSAG